MRTTLSQTIQDALLPQNAPRLVKLAVQKLGGLEELEALYMRVRARGRDTIRAVMDELDVVYQIGEDGARRIPQTGPSIIVANHPTGILDGLILTAVLREIRSDLLILANGLLSAAIPELEPLLIPVDLTESRAAVRDNAAGLRRAIEHVASGRMLLVFPAGEVSRFQWKTRQVADREWNSVIARLIRAIQRKNARMTVTPIHMEGANTYAFHTVGAIHPGLRIAMLPRELLNKRGVRMRITVGNPIAPAKLPEDDRECADYLRWRTYLLANRTEYKAQTNRPLRPRETHRKAAEPVMDPLPPAVLRADVEALPPSRRLGQSERLAVYLADAPEIPNVMAEISRLREATFRAVGEGTGRKCDHDRFDEHYQHLFLWNSERDEIAGAYRLAMTDAVRGSHGLSGLYTATLFSYGHSFLDRMGPAIELGRSFVRSEYQRGVAPLLLLWKGIGKFVAMHPECRVLFGPVSISSQYQSISRELMVAYLERRVPLTEWLHLVAGKSPFRARHRVPDFAQSRLDLDDLSSLIAEIEPDGRGVPVLLRQYLKLGGRLLGFNIDPDFSDALDGLIVVDLMRTEPRLLARYFGKVEAAALLDFQKEADAA